MIPVSILLCARSRKCVLLASMILISLQGSAQIASWDFTGENTALATSAAEVFNANMDVSNLITRGAGATASAANNSFRTVGFQNNGIAVANTDYFQLTLSASTGFTLSLSTIDARFAGTAGYAVSPGVSSQFAYSLDGTTFTLIGSPSVTIGTPATLPQINLSAVTALQNVPAATTITLRYYASGQTTTGGWGFNSAATPGTIGLAIGGAVAAVSSCSLTLPGPNTAVCNSFTNGTDNYTVSIPFTGGNTGVTVVYGGTGTVAGTDPATNSSGTISITIPEGENYNVSFASPCTSLVVSGTSPSCVPPCGVVLGAVTATCNTLTAGSGDTYNLTIAYTGSQAGVTVVNSSGSGTVAGDNPAVTANGTILVNGISELNNYSVSLSAPCAAQVVSGNAPVCAPLPLAAWDLFGESSPATSTADVYNADLDASNVLTRGAGAASSTGGNSFRTVGFQNNGIATTNTDYFQFTLSADPGFALSLSTIDARMAGTAGYAVSPGVSSQFAYSLDGTTFTLIGSPSVTIGTPATITPAIDLTGIPALQNVGAGLTLTLRYYASGQTTTGGWGFFSAAAGTYGLAIGGTLASVPITCDIDLLTPTTNCEAVTIGTDSYTVSIPYTGSQTGVSVQNNSGSGTVGGDDPASVANGVITVSGITEGQAYSVNLTSPCTDQTVSGASPTCYPPCTITPGTAVATCNGFSVGTGDTYNLSIPYTGSQAGVAVLNNSGSGTVGGDDPAVTPNGTIVISGISELNNYSVTFSAPCTALVVSGAAPACVPPALAAWDFFGESVQATSAADVYNASLDASSLLIRGGSAASSAGANSFRTQGFQNNGIATTNSDYFQLTLSTTPGFALSLATINARLAGTTTFAQAPGVSSQFAYSLDGTNFSLIGTPSVTVGTPATLTQIDVTGIPALQNIGSGVTVTLRYYASGQTTTGGWGFTSSATGVYGLRIGGSLTSVGAGCLVSLGTPVVNCNTSTAGPDTYSVTIPYTGSQLSLTVINNSASGIVGGDDPGVTTNGTIVVSGISETDAYSITLSEPCNDQVLTGPAPLCEQPPVIVINEVDYDETGDDLREFIELKNIGLDPSTLTGMKVILYNGSNATVYGTITLPNVSLAAGDYYVIGSALVPNVDQVAWVQDGIQNGAPDGIRLTTVADVILDQMSYEGTMLTTEGTSAGTDPNPAGLGLSRVPDGTDTNNNSVDFVITCSTPGVVNGGTDSDGDLTPDCLDVCPGNSEPGSACDDLNDGTGNDIRLADCSCEGEVIDCLGEIGGPALPGTTCIDGNPLTINDVYQANCDCEGELPDCLGVIGGTALPGTPCNDNDPSTNDETYQTEPYCTCVGTPCSQNVTLELRTDLQSQQAGWEILYQNDATVVCSGGYNAGTPYATGITAPITESCCLPIGCFRLRVLDSAGDGFTSGGYQLRESGETGRRIIDNFGNFTTGTTSAILQTLDVGAFCMPISSVKPIFASCDKLDWVNYQFIVASEDATVTSQYILSPTNTGYEFWFFEPNGSYSYRRFRSHSTTDGTGTGATRACHFKVNKNVPQPPGNQATNREIPYNTLLNVRIRARIAGTNMAFGPACLFKIDAAAASCPVVKLQDNPLNTSDFSCGVTRSFGGANSSANKIVANPPQFAPAVVASTVRYQFRFRIPGEVPMGGGAGPSCIVRPPQTSATLYLNWTTGDKLKCNTQYEVDVRVSKTSGATWCIGGATNDANNCGVTVTPWGKVCKVNIGTSTFCPIVEGLSGGSNNLNLQNADLTMYPNPNRGDQLFLTINSVPAEVNTVTVDFYDLTGKRVNARTIAVQEGFLNTVLDLNGDMAQGLYLVNITAGAKTWTERLVIE